MNFTSTNDMCTINRYLLPPSFLRFGVARAFRLIRLALSPRKMR
jgi:hypothetical protein